MERINVTRLVFLVVLAHRSVERKFGVYEPTRTCLVEFQLCSAAVKEVKEKKKEKNWLKINDVQSLKVFFIAIAGGLAVRGIKAESVTEKIL